MNVKPYAQPQPEKVLKSLINVWHGHGMQFERFYSLNQSVAAWSAHLHQVGISQLSQIWGSICGGGGNSVSVKPYAHPQSEKVLKHLIKV